MTDIYQNYSEWKTWAVDFQYTEEDAVYYGLEFGPRIKESQKVLEIGFGSGGFLQWARDRGAIVFGVEIQPDLVAAAKIANFPAVTDSADLLTEHRGTFDSIVAIDVFEHLDHEQIRQAFSIISDLLKPNGQFIFRVPNGQSPFSGCIQHGDITHKSVLTPNKVTHLSLGIALRVIEVRNQARAHTMKSLLGKIGKQLQYAARTASNVLISKIYGLGTTILDANMVIVMRKDT